MKFIIIFLGICILTLNTIAQSPDKISYQSVIRDQSNLLVNNKPIGVKISIIKGSISGNPVYIEIFNPNPYTNDNGLLTIEIGSGISLLGKFFDINWADGTYFIKSEIDPTGGTNYSIVGISQLLSVPYALHAKSATSIIGQLNELDPLWKVSPSFNISNDNITNWNTSFGWGNHANAGYLKSFNELDPLWKASPSFNITNENITNWNNKQNKIKAGNNITISGDTISVIGFTKLKIGDYFQGGKIFWLDSTGQHGLIAAVSDQSSGIRWDPTPFVGQSRASLNAYRNGIGAGIYNTERIRLEFKNQTYAAQICSIYQVGNWGDWYLPSAYELSLLYNQKNIIGGFTNDLYWSSTESEDGMPSAYRIDFNNGEINFLDRSWGLPSSGVTVRCRAIRRF